MLSSATLFHFTNSLENLKQILACGFKPFYSSEDLTNFGVQECPGIPMVSFCDIPLSQTKQHVVHYGCYALGLKKKWGMKRNICPVHYIYKDSICARVIRNIYDSLPRGAFYADCSCMKFDTRTAIFFYGKPYEGQLRRKNRVNDENLKEVVFYDEREWRYVPFADGKIKDMTEVPSDVRTMLSQKEYETGDVLSSASRVLHNNYKLTFGAEDVRYLIVKTESEISELVDLIDGVRGRGGSENSELAQCTNDERKRLTARLISMTQIQEDF